ncbi:MAG: hypothetical protein CMN28_07755 [Salinisphaeraceae bacterium]|nr:hypothetical protein [Salinisphaeraceae bacterium]
MTRRLLTLTLALVGLATATLLAAQPTRQEATEKPPAGESAASTPAEREAPPPPRRDFKPSERIRADTVVAFPADI